MAENEAAPYPKLIASDAMISLARPEPPPAKKIIEEADPLRSFANDSFQFQADMRQWMTSAPEARAARLKAMCEKWSQEAAKARETKDELEVVRVRERRWRTLSFVVWAESRPAGNGSKDIALTAADQLFGKK